MTDLTRRRGQDPYFRMTRDVAPRLGCPPPPRKRDTDQTPENAFAYLFDGLLRIEAKMATTSGALPPPIKRTNAFLFRLLRMETNMSTMYTLSGGAPMERYLPTFAFHSLAEICAERDGYC